jgi:hypothetical protein
MHGDDYHVVMAYLNQYCLDTFACLEVGCKYPHAWILNLAN